MSSKHQELAGFIWSVADLLRGDYKQSEYGKVILPFTVLRRLDCVMAPTREAVLDRDAKLSSRASRTWTPMLRTRRRAAVLQHQPAGLRKLLVRDPDNVGNEPAVATSAASPPNAREIFDKYDFDAADHRLDDAEPALPGGQQVRRHRPAAPTRCRQPPDGLRLRGADPPVLGNLQRDRR